MTKTTIFLQVGGGKEVSSADYIIVNHLHCLLSLWRNCFIQMSNHWITLKHVWVCLLNPAIFSSFPNCCQVQKMVLVKLQWRLSSAETLVPTSLRIEEGKYKNDVHTLVCLCVPTSMQIVTNSATLWRENYCRGLKKVRCTTFPQRFDISISMLYILMFCSSSVLSLCNIIKLCQKMYLQTTGVNSYWASREGHIWQ